MRTAAMTSMAPSIMAAEGPLAQSSATEAEAPSARSA
eukprot:CAMPEP_0170630626 /NCGR_PEP_ID=MMETSP0224-20130122/34125_1 /TAXON_ID=285029 /ORGANISM="Togula jolla, Strain CCCM 725" /LENGTH=36 /DNA_ID= /DNA_START= /DNA_END= /DNA_ORIENTATION=